MNQLEAYILEQTGMTLSDAKRPIIMNRVEQRMTALRLPSIPAYLRHIQSDEDERIGLINSVTVNETYFFREKRHFEFLGGVLAGGRPPSRVRVWSAASSVGAEAYSVAMMLSHMDIDHEIVGSDINTEVLETARLGRYPLSWVDKIPEAMKKKYCLKGKGPQQGWFLVDRALVKRVRFLKKNLLFRHPDLGKFDIIFLRNVLLYFTSPTKQQVVNYALENLNINGYLITSNTEHIMDLGIGNIRRREHSIYQKVSN